MYFKEVDSILAKNNFKELPNLIYNVDEKGITLSHIPSHVVAEINSHPPTVTSGKSSTITIAGCGSASDVAVPPTIEISLAFKQSAYDVIYPGHG